MPIGDKMADLNFKLTAKGDDRVDLKDLADFSKQLCECLRRTYRLDNPGLCRLPRYAVKLAQVASYECAVAGPDSPIEQFESVVSAIRRKTLPHPRFTIDDAREFKKMTDVRNSQTDGIFVQGISLDEQFIAGCDQLIENASRAFGEAVGYLDGINIHRSPCFRLYLEGQDRGVECRFPEELIADVRSSLGSRVRIRGTIVRDPNGVSIASIDEVIEVQSMPKDDEIPTLLSLFGIFKNDPTVADSFVSEWE